MAYGRNNNSAHLEGTCNSLYPNAEIAPCCSACFCFLYRLLHLRLVIDFLNGNKSLALDS